MNSLLSFFLVAALISPPLFSQAPASEEEARVNPSSILEWYAILPGEAFGRLPVAEIDDYAERLAFLAQQEPTNVIIRTVTIDRENNFLQYRNLEGLDELSFTIKVFPASGGSRIAAIRTYVAGPNCGYYTIRFYRHSANGLTEVTQEILPGITLADFRFPNYKPIDDEEMQYGIDWELPRIGLHPALYPVVLCPEELPPPEQRPEEKEMVVPGLKHNIIYLRYHRADESFEVFKTLSY